jgi:hypothetical protein
MAKIYVDGAHSIRERSVQGDDVAGFKMENCKFYRACCIGLVF